MSREDGWVRYVCDGSSKHCVVQAFVKEGDTKAKNIWHEREYITKDGEKLKFTLCDSCDQEWREMVAKHDDDIAGFTAKGGN